MTSPVIIIGMHRSGTTVVAELLRQMGLFIGWALDANAEASFFVTRNELILRSQGATWDRPLGVDSLLEQKDLRQKLLQELQQDVRSFRTASYLGFFRYLKYRSLYQLDFPWGWKDPRNTFLLPFWMELFPEARVIHIVRNGVDVALSLAARENVRLQRILRNSRHPAVHELVSGLPENTSRLGWTWTHLARRARERGLASRYVRLRSPSCLELEAGFALWELYVARAMSTGRTIGVNFLEVRLEDLVTDPVGVLGRLAQHCLLDVSRERLRALTPVLDPSVRFRFLRDSRAERFYRQIRSTSHMTKLGYNLIEENV